MTSPIAPGRIRRRRMDYGFGRPILKACGVSFGSQNGPGLRRCSYSASVSPMRLRRVCCAAVKDGEVNRPHFTQSQTSPVVRSTA